MQTLARLLVAALLPVVGFTSFASAQDYPNKPIRVVVPFGPGTGPDVLARVVSRQLETQLKQSILIENRGGANGSIGARVVAQAPPDGYTLLYTPTAFSINPSVYKNLPFDTRKDFVPVADIGLGIGLFLLVNPKLPVKTVPELIEYGKARPLAFGSPGVGNSLHLAGELFNVRTGLKMAHVPLTPPERFRRRCWRGTSRCCSSRRPRRLPTSKAALCGRWPSPVRSRIRCFRTCR